MSKLWTWISGLFGNNPKVIALIFVFLIILVFFAVRCSKAATTEAHLSGGASFGCLHYGPVLALDILTPIDEGFAWDAGTNLWGRAAGVRNNFDIHARVEFSRGGFGAAIGPAWLQNIDAVDGSHLNFNLVLFWRPLAWRLGAEVLHISNGGTSERNCGRNAGLADWRLR